jgi:uncharacterized protein involved in exopolysaccharide biosynthesis
MSIDETSQKKTIVDYVAVFNRRKWWMTIPFAMLTIITVIVAFSLPSVYRSTAIILIEQQDIPSEMVRSTITSFADERIQVISQRVMTTQNLSEVIKKYNLYTTERETDTREEINNKMRSDISREMISAEVIDPRSGTPTKATIAFKLSYDNESPELSQKVANELVTLYLNENLKTRTQKAAEATGFLTEEAERLKNQIENIDTNLAIFKEKHSGSLPELINLNLSLVEKTERELFETDQRISTIEDRIIYLESELDQLSPTSGVYSDSGERILSPQGRLSALETKYISASAVYKEKHPDLLKIKRELESLRKELGSSMSSKEDLDREIVQVRSTISQIEKTYGSHHPDLIKARRKLEGLQFSRDELGEESNDIPKEVNNPAYIQLKVKLRASNNELVSLINIKKRLDSKLTELEERILKTPQVERQYLSLMRDKKNAEAKYQELATKRMTAVLAEELERDSKGERFSLIEPPLLPEKPVKPNRIIIIVLGVFVSFSAGLGLALIVESQDTSIRHLSDINQVLGVPPLASIPYIVTNEEARDQRTKRYIYLGLSTAATLSAVMSIHSFYKPLDVIWYVMLRKLGV